MLSIALAHNEEYEEKINSTANTAINLAPTEVRDKMDSFRMIDAFSEEAPALRFPKLIMEVDSSFFFDKEHIPLKSEHLEEEFTLKDKNVQIDFSTIDSEMARIDTNDTADAAPKVWKINGVDSAYFQELFNAQPLDVRLNHCKELIKGKISKPNCVNDKELKNYIDRVVDTIIEDQISYMEQSIYPYIDKV